MRAIIIMKIKKSYFYAAALEIIFTILLILFLVFVRQQTLEYVAEIQSYAGELDTISQQAAQGDLSPDQRYDIDQRVTSFDKILNRSLILLEFILPLTIFILSVIFFYFIWYFVNKISFKRFLAYSVIPIFLVLASVFFAINYIAYVYSFVDESPVIYFVIALIFLIIAYYIALFGLSNSKPLKFNLKLLIKKFPKVFPFYFLMLITNAAYLVLVFYIFFLTFAKASIVLQSLVTLVAILVINVQRIHITGLILK